jgi:hypothetical protein
MLLSFLYFLNFEDPIDQQILVAPVGPHPRSREDNAVAALPPFADRSRGETCEWLEKGSEMFVLRPLRLFTACREQRAPVAVEDS